MNNAPRHTLRKIIEKYGNDLCANARRCEGLLKDLCGEYRREINVLISAIEERIPLDLLASKNSASHELLLNRLAKRLEDNLGLTTQASQWAVNSWAFALGILNDAEIEAIEKKQNNAGRQIPPSKPVQPITPNPQIPTPTQNPQRQPTQRPPQTQSKPQPPKIYPPIARSPVNVPTPVPKQPMQPSGSNVNVPQNFPQPNNQALNPAPKKYFRKFFGCLFVFFLLIATGIVLLFGVPYAIEVMRETQRSEPPRFPPQ